MKYKKSLKRDFDKYIGWIGLILFMMNIAFISFGFTRFWYTPEMYLITNIAGSMAIAYVSYLKKAYEPFWLNVFALSVTIIGYIFQKIN